LRAGRSLAWCLLLVLVACAASLPDHASCWSELVPEPAVAAAPGTLRGDFEAAARVRGLEASIVAWQAFLAAHDPGEQGYEDAIHARLVNWARDELRRAEALRRGDDEAAARIEAALRRRAEA
jgi:hypothetical protein